MSKTVTLRVPTGNPQRRAMLFQAIAGLVLVATILPSLPIHRHAPFGTWSNSPDPLSVASKVALVKRLDKAADKLPKQHMLDSQQSWFDWGLEILPYMTYEGVINGLARIPYDITPFYFPSSRMFHLSGQAYCADREDRPINGPISLNRRYMNPASPRYGDERALGVLVHEMVHMQGGPFCSGKSEDLEADTQIAAMEVMAAMVNHGNRAVLRPLLLDLRSMVLASLQAEMEPDDYMALVRELANDPYDVSRAEKSLRYWHGHKGGAEELAGILLRYNVTPVNVIIEAAYDGTVERIRLPDADSYECPPCGPVSYRDFKADDLYEFWRNLDEYVDAALV